MNNTPEPNLTPPEDTPVTFCENSKCAEAIYPGNEYYAINGYDYCLSCGPARLDLEYKRTAGR